MKSNIIISFVLLILMALSSCNDKGAEEDQLGNEVESVPPSLQESPDSAEALRLSEREQSELQIKTVRINRSNKEYPVSAPGVVFYDPRHTSVISVPIDGQVSRISKREGEWVRKGEELFRIQSLVFGSLVSDYLIASAEEEYYKGRLERIRQLVKETISSESELAQVESDYNRAVVNLRASSSKLKAIGVSDNEMEKYISMDDIDPVLKIYSPITGVVDGNYVEPGQSVNALEDLSRIVNNKLVLIRGYLNPEDASHIEEGDTVTISRREDRTFLLESTVSSINPGLDEKSMSLVVNIYTETNGARPRPGENVHLSIRTNVSEGIMMIPFSALTYDGNDPIVFVKKGEGIYEKRIIKVMEVGEENVFVSSGLHEGEEVAVSQLFSLKSLSRYDMIAE